MSAKTSLQKKRAFITGASSGIGRAIAVALAEAGARVVLCARRRERLEAVANSVRECGGEAEVVVTDLLEEEQIVNSLADAAEKWDGLDILVNSAGVARQASLVDGATSDWREMMQVNILALAIVSREALRYFPEKGGQILNLCSMSGHRVPGRGGFYSPTKFAVRAMTEGLRQELRLAGNPTRVSCLSPGFVDTELLDDYFRVGGLKKEDAIPFPILQPEDIAELALRQLTAPAHVDITDVLVRPTEQAV